MSISSLFPSCPALMVGGQDRITLCVLEPFIFFFEMFHLLIVPFFDFFFFFYSATLRDSFSFRKEHTQCEREKGNL